MLPPVPKDPEIGLPPGLNPLPGLNDPAGPTPIWPPKEGLNGDPPDPSF